jgi:hypothetical protein
MNHVKPADSDGLEHTAPATLSSTFPDWLLPETIRAL